MGQRFREVLRGGGKDVWGRGCAPTGENSSLSYVDVELHGMVVLSFYQLHCSDSCHTLIFTLSEMAHDGLNSSCRSKEA